MADPLTIEFEFRNKRYSSAALGLRAFYDELEKDWDGAAKVLSRELRDFLDQVAEAIVSRNSQGWPGGTGPNSLSKRSGKLTSAIASSVRVTGDTFDTIQGQIGAPGVPYAGIQEFGGVIKAKGGKYLAIPLPAALDSKGLPLQSSARDWPNTFVAKSKAGNLIIFQKRGTSVIPLYVLKTQVTIPARLGIKKSLDAGLPYFVSRAMDQMVKELAGG